MLLNFDDGTLHTYQLCQRIIYVGINIYNRTMWLKQGSMQNLWQSKTKFVGRDTILLKDAHLLGKWVDSLKAAS